MATTAHDLGNNESAATGYSFHGEQGHLALTLVESRWFKTERGAIAWLARRGYNADGTRAGARPLPTNCGRCGADLPREVLRRAGLCETCVFEGL